jgi:hypothetical protein
MIVAVATLRVAAAIPVLPSRADKRQSFAALRMTEAEMGASMRGGGTLVDSAVFRHLVIFHQTKAPIDQGLFVFVG